MENLLKGVVEFRKKDFEENRELFEKLHKRQDPHTLFIGCSDSRVVPNIITQTLPGEVFVVRNVANIVPVYSENIDFYGTTSAIEYAVQILNVKNIIVCGHSNCGGCAALWEKPENLTRIPHTRKWLELAASVKDKVTHTLKSADHAAREWLTEQFNVTEQLTHLMTYPYIREKVENKTLQLFGWHYMIHSGEIYQYNKESGHFELLGG